MVEPRFKVRASFILGHSRWLVLDTRFGTNRVLHSGRFRLPALLIARKYNLWERRTVASGDW